MNKTAKYFLIDNMLAMGCFWACTGLAIASLTKYYNIPLEFANLLTTLPSTLCLFQLVGGMCFGKSNNKHTLLYVCNFVWRVLLPIIFLSVVFPKKLGMVVFLISALGFVAIYNFVAPSTFDWMLSHTEGKVENNYYSKREMAFCFGFAIIFPIVTLVLYYAGVFEKDFLGYIVLGVFTFVLVAISIYCLSNLPKYSVETVQKKKVKILNDYKKIIRDKNFVKFLVAGFVWSMSCMFIGGFSNVYQVRTVSISFMSITIWTSIGTILRMLGIPICAKYAKKYTWKKIVASMYLLNVILGIFWMVVNKNNMYFIYPIIALLAAVPNAGISVGILRIQMEIIPNEKRSIYLSAYATIGGLGAILGTILSSTMIKAIDTIFKSEEYLRLIFFVGVILVGITILIFGKLKSDCK